jgi:uncharacterized protein (TIGR03083 family)
VENAPQADHIHFLFDPRDSLTAFSAQRRRFASTVEGLSVDELASPSRCSEWTVSDVLRHLVWVDLTVRRIWSGDESIPSGFDPRITPNEAVQQDRAVSDEEIRDRYLLSTETMVTELEDSDRQRFGRPSLSPAGSVPWWMSAVHIGWDSSIHERDVLVPLGRRFEPPAGENRLCLAYSLVLASFFAGRDPLSLRLGPVRIDREAGPVVVQAVSGSDTGDDIEPGLDTVVVTGDLVHVVDALSGRGLVDESLRGDAVLIRRLGGLARYFTSV